MRGKLRQFHKKLLRQGHGALFPHLIPQTASFVYPAHFLPKILSLLPFSKGLPVFGNVL
jgi:hypothetical protein